MTNLALLSEKEYFSIGDVSEIVGVEPYVIRYWESKFGLIRPARRESGQRKFTRRDVESILQVKELLYDRGFTIEGAKKHLKDRAKQGPLQMSFELGDSSAAAGLLRDVKKDLMDILKTLNSADYTVEPSKQ